jgi:hypothetical protein
MKDRYTIIKEEYDVLTGTTTVTINTDCGAFLGSVKLDNIDAQYPSIYHANELALSKALRKYAKQMVIITREKLQPLYAVMEQCMYVNHHSEHQVYGKATFLIRKEIEKLENELELWNKRVETMSNAIINRISARDKLVKTYLDKSK